MTWARAAHENFVPEPLKTHNFDVFYAKLQSPYSLTKSPPKSKMAQAPFHHVQYLYKLQHKIEGHKHENAGKPLLLFKINGRVSPQPLSQRTMSAIHTAPHHHLRLRPSTKDASVTRQSGSALCSCPIGSRLKRNLYSSSLRGALSALLPRLRNPPCLIALCMVHSIEAERSEGGNLWMWAV